MILVYNTETLQYTNIDDYLKSVIDPEESPYGIERTITNAVTAV